jgi:outer membrane protein assembly factor BamE (lipoprotein component of BamABCDE complex)
MNLRNFLRILFVFFVLCFYGCGFIPYYCGVYPYYAVGKKFKPARVSQLIKGSSTRNDVLRLFGKPLSMSLSDPDKAKWWSYHYDYLGVLGVETAELMVSFKGDSVEDFKIELIKNRY